MPCTQHSLPKVYGRWSADTQQLHSWLGRPQQLSPKHRQPARLPIDAGQLCYSALPHPWQSEHRSTRDTVGPHMVPSTQLPPDKAPASGWRAPHPGGCVPQTLSLSL